MKDRKTGGDKPRLAKVRDTFEQRTDEYDAFIPRLIPHYQEQNEIIRKLLTIDKPDLKALDLGCGTGILAQILLQQFLQCQVTGFDLSDNMLKVCADKLKVYANRLMLQQGNFAVDEIGSGYDLVLSGLAIHHLEDNDKQLLYHRIYDSLNPGGLFINRDIVISVSPHLTDLYEKLWCEYIRANGEDDVKWFAEYLEEDRPASLEIQLKWLQEAGFSDVVCHWRYLNFAIFGGHKA